MKTIHSELIIHLVNNYAREAEPIHASMTDYLKTQISTSIENHNYSTAIYLIAELIDAGNQVFWHKVTIQDQFPLLIRDTRSQTNLLDRRYGLAMNAIHHVRTTLVLCPDLDFETQSLLKDLTVNFWTNFSTTPHLKRIDEVGHFIHTLTHFVAKTLQITPEQAHKQLNQAKDYVNLEDQTFHVATLSQCILPDQPPLVTFKIDAALTGLTDQQINLMAQDAIWNESLDDTESKVFKKYQSNFLNGEHVFPTQLRKIPGSRNFYCQYTGLITSDGPILLNTTYHAGTIAFLGKNEAVNQLIANSNLAQLSLLIAHHQQSPEEATELTLKPANIHLITLNSQHNPLRGNNDPTIVKQTKQAIGQALSISQAAKAEDQSQDNYLNLPSNTEHRYTNLPLNFCRKLKGVKKKLTGEIYDGLIELINIVANQCLNTNEGAANSLTTDQKFQAIIKYYLLKEGSVHISYLKKKYTSEKDVYTLLEGYIIENPSHFQPYHQCIAIALYCRHLININKGFKDPNNRNLTLATLSCQLGYLLRCQGIYPAYIVSLCQSGKDRDGLVLYANQVYSTFYALMKKMPSESVLKNPDDASMFQLLLKHFAMVGHQQFVASTPNSTIGCTGIKQDTASCMPSYWPHEVKNYFILEAGKYNKSLPSTVTLVRRLTIDPPDPKKYLQNVLGNTPNQPQKDTTMTLLNIMPPNQPRPSKLPNLLSYSLPGKFHDASSRMDPMKQHSEETKHNLQEEKPRALSETESDTESDDVEAETRDSDEIIEIVQANPSQPFDIAPNETSLNLRKSQ